MDKLKSMNSEGEGWSISRSVTRSTKVNEIQTSGPQMSSHVMSVINMVPATLNVNRINMILVLNIISIDREKDVQPRSADIYHISYFVRKSLTTFSFRLHQ